MFNTHKDYFKKKLDGVKKMIWDLEFKRFKTREIREEVRQTYDQQKAKLLSIEMTIEQQEEATANTMPEGDVAGLKDEVVRLKRDIERYEAQVRHLDVEVDGSRETNEYPDGVSGISQQLESLHELEVMIRDYIKGL